MFRARQQNQLTEIKIRLMFLLVFALMLLVTLFLFHTAFKSRLSQIFPPILFTFFLPRRDMHKLTISILFVEPYPTVHRVCSQFFHSRITSSMALRTIRVLQIEPRAFACKANTQPSVLMLRPTVLIICSGYVM